MARGFPSMTALLALLAVAGYQNRDKLADMLNGGHAVPAQQPPQGTQPSPLENILGGLRSALGSGGIGGLLNNGLRELSDRFNQSGHGDVAQSWINTGPNQQIEPHQLKDAIGSDVLAELSTRTGLSQAEVLARLSQQLPGAVDKYTPEGRLPA